MENTIAQRMLDAIPGAAMQFAQAVVDSRKKRAQRHDGLANWYGRKVALLAGIHALPAGLAHALLFYGYDAPDLEYQQLLIRVGLEWHKPDSGITPAMKLALLASSEILNPFAGILAFSPQPSERTFWRPKIKRVYERADQYMTETTELLGGLLCIAYPALLVDSIDVEALIARGLPDQMPEPDWEW